MFTNRPLTAALAVGTLLLFATAVPGQVARSLAAPPADIASGLLALPDPAELTLRSRTASLPVVFDAGGRFEVELPVDHPGELVLVPLAPGVADWSLSLQAPVVHRQGGERQGVERQAAEGQPGDALDIEAWVASGRARQDLVVLPELGGGLSAPRWTVQVARAGSWSLGIQRPVSFAGGTLEGLLLVDTGTPGVLVSHRTTHQLHAASRIGFVAWIEEDATGSVAGPGHGTFWIAAETPLGSLTIPMHDDGRSGDGRAGDGIWGGALPPLPPGAVIARIQARDDHAWRTTTHAFHVVERAALLTGEARAVAVSDEALSVEIEAWPVGAPARLHVSAEVWGRVGGGGFVPVAWLSRILDPPADDAASTLTLALELDARWLALAGVGADLQLRQVRLQDPDTHAVHDVLERMPLAVAALPAAALLPVSAVTPGMLTGSPGSSGSADLVGAGTLGRTLGAPPPPVRSLLLTHGYCSGGNIWPDGDFTGNTIEFFDPDANRSHDEFAQLLAQAAEVAGADSFGVVGHSQGGCAALHLLTYYSSGLDLATGNRRIQALATPWHGTPLAGSLADIGAIFGLGCGSNDDLTDAGAALWLSGIPSWARAEVSYWTTSDDGCSAISFLLDNPDDGVVEMAAGQLSGADNRGHVTGWCHSTGMSAPASYTDSARNAEMDTEAAR